MNQAASMLTALLERERTAALSADVDALTALQAEKRTALDSLRAQGLSDAELEALRQSALTNVQLIRHLVGCLHGLSGSEATYTPGGARPLAALGRSRGRL